MKKRQDIEVQVFDLDKREWVTQMVESGWLRLKVGDMHLDFMDVPDGLQARTERLMNIRPVAGNTINITQES